MDIRTTTCLRAPGGGRVGGRTARVLTFLRDLLAPIPGATSPAPEPGDLVLLLAILQRSALLPSAWPAIRSLTPGEREALGPSVVSQARRAYEEVRAENLLRLAVLQPLAEALAREGVRAVALKGTALLLGYLPDPSTRDQSDIDLYVREVDREAAARGFRHSGFAPSREEESQASWVLPAGRGIRIGVEMHWALFHGELRFRWGGGQVLARSGPAPGLPGGIVLPSPEDMFLYGAAHSVLRQKDRCKTLRALFDLRAIAGHPDFSWEGLALRARGSGIESPLRIRLVDLLRWFPGLVPPGLLSDLPHAGMRAAIGGSVHALEVARAIESGRSEDPTTRLGRPILELLWAPTWLGGIRAVWRSLPRKGRSIAAGGRPRGTWGLMQRYARVAAGWIFRGDRCEGPRTND